jgi:hypothetical protein
MFPVHAVLLDTTVSPMAVARLVQAGYSRVQTANGATIQLRKSAVRMDHVQLPIPAVRMNAASLLRIAAPTATALHALPR